MNSEVLQPPSPPTTPQPDWFLQSLVNIVNGKDFEFGITLQVSGFLISGNLVCGKRYFEGFAEDFSNIFAATPEAAASTKRSFAQFGKIYEKAGDEKVPDPQYIHLKNARFFNTSGNPIPGNKGVLWRGRLSEVASFFLGNLSTAD